MKRSTHMGLTVLRVGIALVLLGYLGLSGAIDWSALRGLATAWPLTLAALMLMLLDIGISAWRLCVLLRPRDLHLTLGASFRLTLIGNFFNNCLPGATGGDAVKIYYATLGNHGRRTEVATVLLLDRAVGMFSLLICPLLIAPFFPELMRSSDVFSALLLAAAAVAGTMVLGVLVTSSRRVRHSRLLSWVFQRLPLGNYAERIVDTVHAYRHNALTLLGAAGISLLAHSLAIGIALLVAESVCPGGAVWQMSALIPLGLLANTLPLTPGGLGVGEAALSQLFALAGLTGGAETQLGWRLVTMLAGLVGLGFYLKGQQRFIHARETVQEIEATNAPELEPANALRA